MLFLIVYDHMIHLFFFFKQKTAYEMRISDWSSDVCSSDLHSPARICPRSDGIRLFRIARSLYNSGVFKARINGVGHRGPSGRLHRRHAVSTVHDRRAWLARSTKENRFPVALVRWRASFHAGLPHRHRRSAEHTSELRSLMRISNT